jgi:hypothetical protein
MGNCPLVDKFARIGAEVRIETMDPRARLRSDQIREITIDVQPRACGGERFVIRHLPGMLERLEVIDLQPRLRHLLLMHRQDQAKARILCGHDERHWFACTVGTDPVKSVKDAMEHLKPDQARDAQRMRGVRRKDWNRRHNAGFLRQGEWFFIPLEQPRPFHEWMIHRHEPLRRNMLGKAHFVEELIREGGETVQVHSHWAPQGLTAAEFQALCDTNRKARDAGGWHTMRRNPRMFGRGAVRHPDHATIHLLGWHEIQLNRESVGGGPVIWFD